MRRAWCVLVVGVLGLSLGSAAGQAKKDAKADPGDVVVFFHDGTRVKTFILQENVEVTTRFGKLTVPTKAIRRIEFGHRLSDEQTQKLENALKRLASNNFQDREAAGKELIAMGRMAYPALVKAGENADLDTTKRLDEILKAIKQAVPAEQLRSRLLDLVYTEDFTIAGKIDSTVIKAKTEHFGEVALKVVDLRSVLASGATGETKVTIDAVAYGTNNTSWMDTGYMCNPDQKLVITATGEVDLYGNQQPGQYITGPEGNRNVGRQGVYMPGTLVGKIGEDGPVFVVARKYEGSSSIEGKLYLRIVALQGSGGSTGNYQVKITNGE
jgi:hypothetical protein